MECDELGKLGSGDNVDGAACGIVFSKSSALNRVEKVLFASSAIFCQHGSDIKKGKSHRRHTFLKVELAMGSPLLGLGRCGWRTFFV